VGGGGCPAPLVSLVNITTALQAGGSVSQSLFVTLPAMDLAVSQLRLVVDGAGVVSQRDPSLTRTYTANFRMCWCVNCPL
jgi:hypothetical protein